MRRWRRPNWQVLLVPLTIYGAALAFQAYSYASGSTFPFLRFYIIAIPLSTCLAMLAVPEGQLISTVRRGRYAPPVQPPDIVRRRWAAYAPVAAVAIAVPVTAWGMSQPKYAPQEYALGAVLAPDPDSVSERKALEHRIAATFTTERHIAHYLDRLNLPESSVITDTVYGFAVLAASQRPKTFVVPSDPDFTALLNAPAEGGIITCSPYLPLAGERRMRSTFAIRRFIKQVPKLRRSNSRYPTTVTVSRIGDCIE